MYCVGMKPGGGLGGVYALIRFPVPSDRNTNKPTTVNEVVPVTEVPATLAEITTPLLALVVVLAVYTVDAWPVESVVAEETDSDPPVESCVIEKLTCLPSTRLLVGSRTVTVIGRGD